MFLEIFETMLKITFRNFIYILFIFVCLKNNLIQYCIFMSGMNIKCKHIRMHMEMMPSTCFMFSTCFRAIMDATPLRVLYITEILVLMHSYQGVRHGLKIGGPKRQNY